jgi:hypothetical protein
MSKRLQIKLFSNWISVEGDREDYPYRLFPKNKTRNSILDITFAEYKGGIIPNPTYDDLVNLAKNKSTLQIVNVEHGDCKLGKYGVAQFSSNNVPFFQKWFLSNGKDFIIAEYQSLVEPSDSEVREVRSIIKNLDLIDE